MKYLYVLILLAFLFTGCNHEKYFKENVYAAVSSRFDIDQDEIYVYRFIGDCPLCYSEIVNLEKTRSNRNAPLILIVNKENVDIVNYKLKELAIICFVISYEEKFNMLELNKVYLINEKNAYKIIP